MSDTPGDQGSDAQAYGRTPGWGGTGDNGLGGAERGLGGPERGLGGREGGAGAGEAGSGAGERGAGDGTGYAVGARAARPRRLSFEPVPERDPDSPAGRRRRRRQRLFVAGIAVAAAVVVIALCAGTVGAFSTWRGVRDRAADARQERQLRETACLELEQRLNRLSPPGANTSPQAKAVAVQNENAAVRIYVAEIHGERDQDAWRQLLDARTAYAEALDQQAKTRTPAFYVAPRDGNGGPVTADLLDRSPSSCAGAIRRLAAPDL